MARTPQPLFPGGPPPAPTNLRRARKTLGVTAATTQRACHITSQTLANIESARANPSLRIAISLARFHRTSIEELFADWFEAWERDGLIPQCPLNFNIPRAAPPVAAAKMATQRNLGRFQAGYDLDGVPELPMPEPPASLLDPPPESPPVEDEPVEEPA